MTTYAVTGATGGLGGAAIDALLAHGVQASDIVAIVRDPAKATGLADAGVTVRQADYTDVDALMAQAMYRLRGDAGYQLLVTFGTRRIRRAIEQSRIAAEHQAWLDEQTLEPDLEVQAQILASLASVQGAA